MKSTQPVGDSKLPNFSLFWGFYGTIFSAIKIGLNFRIVYLSFELLGPRLVSILVGNTDNTNSIGYALKSDGGKQNKVQGSFCFTMQMKYQTNSCLSHFSLFCIRMITWTATGSPASSARSAPISRRINADGWWCRHCRESALNRDKLLRYVFFHKSPMSVIFYKDSIS